MPFICLCLLPQKANTFHNEVIFVTFELKYDFSYVLEVAFLTFKYIYIQVVEVLNPLAREYKSVGTLRKELAGLQDELEQAHKKVKDLIVYETRLLSLLSQFA